MTLGRLAVWGLGPVPTAENLGHEETTRRSKYRLFFSFLVFSSSFFFFFFFFLNLFFLVTGMATMKENREKTITSGDEDTTVPSVV